VQTINFTTAGQRQVPGKIIRTRTAGGGWAAIEVVSPVVQLSNKVSYRLLCGAGHNPDGITAAASVQPAAKTVTCGTAPPAFTATGSITSHEAAEVTYYWALSDGQTSPPATLQFTAPGTMTVKPFTVTPRGDPASGEAVLVVTSPVVAASSPAKYTLSCTPPPPLTLSASAQVSPKSESVACSPAPPVFTFSGTITANEATTVGYFWKLPSGDGPPQTLTFTQAGTRAVSPDSFPPGTQSTTGSGQIIITSPQAAASNAAAFTLSCGQGKFPPLSLRPASGALPSGTAGDPYSATVTASGGDGNYSWSAPAGLPAGLSFSTAGGTLTVSGTPTGSGSHTVSVSVSDGESPAQATSATLTITINDAALSLSPAGGALPSGTVGDPYSQQISVTGGDGQYTFACGSAPAWMSCSQNGGTYTISGTPATAEEAGTYTFTVSVSDGESPAQTASATFTVTINNVAVSLSPAGGTLPSGTVGVPYSASVTASGGFGEYTFACGGAPAWMSCGQDGDEYIMSGTPTEPGSYTFTVSVSDGESPAQTAAGTFTVTINNVAVSLSPAGGTLPSGTVGVPYSATVTASGGDGRYTFACGSAPAWMSCSQDGDAYTISGTSKESGTYTFTVSVSDGESPAQTASATLTVTINDVTPATTQPTQDGLG
jgi:hypothetical protein